jgi:hypothetical protein
MTFTSAQYVTELMFMTTTPTIERKYIHEKRRNERDERTIAA